MNIPLKIYEILLKSHWNPRNIPLKNKSNSPQKGSSEVTIQQLRDAVASETAARQALEKDADAQTRELSQQVSEWHLGAALRFFGWGKTWGKHCNLLGVMGIYVILWGDWCEFMVIFGGDWCRDLCDFWRI